VAGFGAPTLVFGGTTFSGRLGRPFGALQRIFYFWQNVHPVLRGRPGCRRQPRLQPRQGEKRLVAPRRPPAGGQRGAPPPASTTPSNFGPERPTDRCPGLAARRRNGSKLSGRGACSRFCRSGNSGRHYLYELVGRAGQFPFSLETAQAALRPPAPRPSRRRPAFRHAKALLQLAWGRRTRRGFRRPRSTTGSPRRRPADSERLLSRKRAAHPTPMVAGAAKKRVGGGIPTSCAPRRGRAGGRFGKRGAGLGGRPARVGGSRPAPRKAVAGRRGQGA